jgi:hypothetical protein
MDPGHLYIVVKFHLLSTSQFSSPSSSDWKVDYKLSCGGTESFSTRNQERRSGEMEFRNSGPARWSQYIARGLNFEYFQLEFMH